MKKVMGQKGFAHPVLLVAISIIVVGVISFAGYRVYQSNNAKNNSKSSASTQELRQEKQQDVKRVEIKTANTAKTDTGATFVETAYDVSTAHGSLKTIEKYYKAYDFGSSLSFITPGMMFQTADALGTGTDSDAVNSACKNNAICRLGVNSTNLGTDYTEEEYTHPHSGTTAKKLIFNLRKINKAAADSYGDQRVVFHMVDIGDHWVLDRIEVGNYVL